MEVKYQFKLLPDGEWEDCEIGLYMYYQLLGVATRMVQIND